MANLVEGEGFIGGRTSDIAKRALAAAERAGFGPEVVRSTLEGFIVPEKVLDEYENPTTKKEPAKKTASKTTAKATAKATTKEE